MRDERVYLIVGLGNPGRQYERTRHNVGFDVLDFLSDGWKIPISKAKHRAVVGEGIAGGRKIVLAKPQTYMNESGHSVVELLRFYKPPLGNMIVVYDDIDLPVAAVRIRKHGSAGTHNGMRSIIGAIGSEMFPRVRVGIGRPVHPGHDLKDFVLTRYRDDEMTAMFNAFRRAAQGARMIVEGDIDGAMREINANDGVDGGV